MSPEELLDFSRKIEVYQQRTKFYWKNPDKSFYQDYFINTLNKANSLVPVADYINQYRNLAEITSSTGWIYRTTCPFHKNGNETSPSFFINPETNKFYCHGCSIVGGIVQFISIQYKMPEIIVAEGILDILDGKVDIEASELNQKLKEKANFEKHMLKLSVVYKNFVIKNCFEDEAITFANKCMEGFDRVWLEKPEKVEKNIEELVSQISLYLDKYK